MIVGGRVRFLSAGRALRHRNFRFFFFGQLVSVTGTWMQSVAQGWLMITLVGSNEKGLFYLGVLGAVQWLPVLIFGLFGGIIADVWPKRRTVIATQTVAGILALILAALVYSGTVQVWHIFLLGFCLGWVNLVDMPTRQAFVVEMVGSEDVANAVALNSAVFNGARIVGPAIGGALIAAVGTATCFLLNGLSYAAVVLGLLLMRDSELLPAARLPLPRNATAVRANMAEGLGYVWRTPVVLLAIAVIGFVSTFGMNFNVVLPVIASGILKVGPEGYGALYSSMGAGALVAALAVATLHRPRIRILIAGGIILGASEFVLAATTSYPVAIVAVFLAGLGAIATSISANSLVQVTVPGALRGRVMSVYTTVFSGSTPIGNGLTGAFGGLWGTPAALLMNGGVSLIATVVAGAAVLRKGIVVGGRPTGRGDTGTAAAVGELVSMD